jgi:hypothetical protein
MRLYEAACDRIFSTPTLDALTLDTMQSAVRREKAGQRKDAIAMFQECWYSNLIAYLADYSVHQVILTYGYYKYVQTQRRKLKSENEEEVQKAEKNLHIVTMTMSIAKSVSESLDSLTRTEQKPLWLYSFPHTLCCVAVGFAVLHAGCWAILCFTWRSRWYFYSTWMGYLDWYQYG